jgi:hypothetical protein
MIRLSSTTAIRPTLLAIGLITIVMSGFLAYGQVSTASVRGTVADPQGALVPQADLVLTNVDTRVELRTVSNAAGVYVLLNVPPGNYTLQASASGLATQKLSPFVLAVNQSSTLDFRLQIGGVQQVIEVEAVGQAVQSATSELGSVVTTKEVVDLPLNGRNFTSLLVTVPGVAAVVAAGSQVGSRTRPIGTFVVPSFNGQTNRSNLFVLDGVLDSETLGNAYAVPPIIDAIQELKAQTHNDSAEFGGSLGGTINVVTKSGTNTVHGTVWEFIKNNAFNARNTFQPSVGAFRQNQFGISMGGPVYVPKLYDGRNKTFFFFAYEGFRFTSPALTYMRVPTAANYAGDFTGVNPIYDAATTRLDPATGSYIRTPFAGNQIPANRLNQGAIYYAQHVLPAAQVVPIPGYNALDATPQQIRQSALNGRVDETFGNKDSAFFRYSLISQTGSGGRQQLKAATGQDANQYSLSWVHAFGPTSILQVQGGRVFSSVPTSQYFQNLPSDFLQKVGLPEGLTQGFGSIGQLVPGLDVTGYFSGDEQNYQLQAADGWTIKANYSKSAGRHIFRMGGEFNKIGEAWSKFTDYMNFQSYETANPTSAGNTGNALASYMLGLPYQVVKRNAPETLQFGGVMGLYFQDQWQATKKLAINVGLRYDRTFIPAYGTAAANNWYVGNVDFNTGTYVVLHTPQACAVTKAAPCIPTADGSLPANVVASPDGKFLHDATMNFQPRIGLAYRLFPKTAIRAGFGIVFDNYAGVIQTARNINGTWPSISSIQLSNINNPSSANPFPGYTIQNLPPVAALPSAAPKSIQGYYADPNWKDAYSMQWNFGLQHQLTDSTVVSANYVGSGSRRLDVGGEYNVATVPGPGDYTLRQPFPQFSPTEWDRSIGNSSYNSLQLQLNRRFSKGLAGTVAYTWSKSIDVGCSGFFNSEGCSVQQVYNLRQDRSVSAFNIPHAFAVSWNYELPVGKNKALSTRNRAVDYLVGGWQWNGIVQLRSGIPYSITVPSDVANIGWTGYARANLVGDPAIANPTTRTWFNTAAFATPSLYTYGNLGRNTMRTQFMHQFDMSLFRDFPIRERLKVEFRGEAMNVFNNVVYGQPGSSVGQPGFGQITSTAIDPRTLQLSAKIIF